MTRLVSYFQESTKSDKELTKFLRAVEKVYDYLEHDEHLNYMGEKDHIWRSLKLIADTQGFEYEAESDDEFEEIAA